MDAIIGTTKIRWGYPKGLQQPVSFRIEVGRSTGNYFTNFVLTSTLYSPGPPREISVEHLLDSNVTGVYYVRISSIHYDQTEVAGSEFTINVIEPTDAVIAPVVSVY